MFHAKNWLFRVSNTVINVFLLWLLGFRTQVAKGPSLGRAPQASPARQQRQFPAALPWHFGAYLRWLEGKFSISMFQFALSDSAKLDFVGWSVHLLCASLTFPLLRRLCSRTLTLLYYKTVFRFVVCLSFFLFWAQSTHDTSPVSGWSLPFKGTCWILPMALSFVIKSVTITVSYFGVRLFPSAF